jgi:hypothetical protein
LHVGVRNYIADLRAGVVLASVKRASVITLIQAASAAGRADKSQVGCPPANFEALWALLTR